MGYPVEYRRMSRTFTPDNARRGSLEIALSIYDRILSPCLLCALLASSLLYPVIRNDVSHVTRKTIKPTKIKRNKKSNGPIFIAIESLRCHG